MALLDLKRVQAKVRAAEALPAVAGPHPTGRSESGKAKEGQLHPLGSFANPGPTAREFA